MTEALPGFVHCTLTSNLVAQDVKKRWLDICRKAMIAAPFHISPEIFHRFIHAEWEGLLSAVQFGLLLGGVDHIDPVTTYHSRVMLSIILPRMKELDRDKDWFELATNHLGISRRDLNHYLTCGVSLLLANCIAFLRNIISNFFWIPSHGDVATLWETLRLVSKFDIEGTLPSLQHNFCHRWNDIIDIAGIVGYNRDRSTSIVILMNLRHAYLTLHRNINPASTELPATANNDDVLPSLSSYPRCNVPSHCQHPASHA